jgi:sigma-B regulation protein RsbU (phosphoserine phosphatase)
MGADRSDSGRRGERRRATGVAGAPAKAVAVERRRDERRRRGLELHVDLFHDAGSAELEATLAACPVLEFAAEHVLLHPGERNSRLFVVLAGHLAVKLDLDDPEPVAIHPGDCVGEMSIIDGEPASAYVIAAAGTRLLVIDEAAFWRRFVLLPGVARNLMRAQTRRMRQGNQAMLARLRQQLQLQAIERDLAAAAEIQRGLLPRDFSRLSSRPQLEVHGLMRPAREIGGDFYDAFFVGERRLFFAIGDVSDKGIAAALFMARSLTLLRTEALHADSPLAAVEGLNRALCQDNPRSMFVTLVCGTVDLASGDVRLVHGGHPPPLRLAAAGADCLDWPTGSVAGVMEGLPFAEARLTLAPGEALLLYTDGVTEARNAAGEMFGVERLRQAAAGAALHPAEGLAAAVAAAVDDFAAGVEPFDDLTLLVLRYRG